VILITALIVILVGSVTVGLTMVIQVKVGDAVVLVDPLLQTTGEPIVGPTYVIKPPWVTAVVIYYSTDSWESVTSSFSSDQLEMNVETLVRWRLNPENLRQLYQNYPNLNYKVVAFESILAETIRLVTKSYTALETIEFRDEVRNRIEVAMIEAVAREPSLAGVITQLELDLRDIAYPDKLTSAIEDKLVAEQQKIQADLEKDRILILADASAQEAVIIATGDAEAKIIEANATRISIEEILMASGQPGNETQIVELYLWIKGLQEIAPDVDIMIVGNDGTPLLIPSDINAP
jgi:regulator of protease activity HflC (stomatin/prohibitin superfamily)